MRLLISLGVILSLTLSPHSGAELAQAAGLAAKHHPWGCFKPGAWRLVRVVNEKPDEEGVITYTSSTDRRTTLLSVKKDAVELKNEVVHEVAGKQFFRDPETLEEGFHGELVSPGLKMTEAGEGKVVIEGREIACHVLQLEFSGPASKTVTKIYYSDTVTPYVLKRESVTGDSNGNNSRSETTINVVTLEMPYRVLAEIQNAAYIKTIQNHPKGTTTTWVVTSGDVPGGVVWRASKEVDKTGRLIRRSLLELVDYGQEPEPERTGLFGGRTRRGIFRKTFSLHPLD